MNDEDRFWAKVAKSDDGCWEWTSSVQGRGYGKFNLNKKRVQAHRWIFERLNGPQPKHIQICHKCDNPRCVRPDHLFAGTRSDNMQDCARKGRNIMQLHPERSNLNGLQHPRVRGEDQGNSKLTAAQVLKIRSMAAAGLSSAYIGGVFAINAGHVRRIIAGKAWAHV